MPPRKKAAAIATPKKKPVPAPVAAPRKPQVKKKTVHLKFDEPAKFQAFWNAVPPRGRSNAAPPAAAAAGPIIVFVGSDACMYCQQFKPQWDAFVRSQPATHTAQVHSSAFGEALSNGSVSLGDRLAFRGIPFVAKFGPRRQALADFDDFIQARNADRTADMLHLFARA